MYCAIAPVAMTSMYLVTDIASTRHAAATGAVFGPHLAAEGARFVRAAKKERCGGVPGIRT
jgi:hypothetical protein